MDKETLQNWEKEDSMLVQTVECENFVHAVDLINRIAVLSQEQGHHPDMCLHDYKYLSIMLKSYDKGDITDKDYTLAQGIDDIIVQEA